MMDSLNKFPQRGSPSKRLEGSAAKGNEQSKLGGDGCEMKDTCPF